MSAEELAEIAQRVGYATEGPWEHETEDFDKGPDTVLANDEILLTTANGGTEAWWNAEFIAHSREDIPRLLAHIAALEERARHFEAAYRAEEGTRMYMEEELLNRTDDC